MWYVRAASLCNWTYMCHCSTQVEVQLERTLLFRLSLLNEDDLPELLRKALQAKREEDEREGMLSGEGTSCLL